MAQEKSWRLFKDGNLSSSTVLLMIIFCVSVMIIDSRTKWLTPVRHTLSAVIDPTYRIAIWPKNLVDKIYRWFNAVDVAQSSVQESQNKSIELAQVETQAIQLSAENSQLRRLLELKENVPVKSLAVEILYIPNNPVRGNIVLNKGEREGIKPGMPVIGEGGLVGQIQRVSYKTSETLLITDESIQIPAILVRNGLRVVVYGAGVGNPLELRYLSPGADVQVGDEIVTSGIGDIYPSGLAIGKVGRIDQSSAQGFVIGLVDPQAKPNRNKHFLVLKTEGTIDKDEGDDE
ncbi:rod shape-determining protein MreC [Taylorella equigenitalis]|uniref:Cell shape-determining protein MreC n=3 Tax=Taylorella equigenitalis TaxID=29575 RepID=A0A654KH56_TAYEM|nr:rod shape-determining protein MreC [Taylorella equigenitalis]ADU91720.1 Rod shape-determining protein MreC [Taylorella equigenitalis MCE9]AFN35288.1 rod shape-determining protein, MreC [Taylorella equigenitalis ATCC 35865]ASY37255.1 rod shape-determining protein MreC [Taylorella equigenitalis]ASY38721.1 rod shape-determining protein MreC [Taylorella equigenitalis]ASY40246.1 rod shape-determining protein MreC [Taylorella equigenitalis]